jgi:hypothetical protein
MKAIRSFKTSEIKLIIQCYITENWGPSKLTFFKSEGTRKMERLNRKVAGYNEAIYKYLKSIEGKKSTT